MTLPQTATADARRNSDWRALARYRLTNRWVLVALGGAAIALGLFFGGWGWLVAAGLAPIVLSTLPCLVMCGLGVCMMCRSGPKQTTNSSDATDTATSSAALGASGTDRSPSNMASCCHQQIGEAKSPPVATLHPDQGKEDSHA